jgi:FkbM family methyltransferase
MNSVIKYFLGKIDQKHPFVYLDVGARGGIPLKWNHVRDFIRVVAFEPDGREFAKLNADRNIKYLNFALHSRSEDIKYYITASPGSSSIMEPNQAVLANYEDEERYRVVFEEIIPSGRVTTLDSVMEEHAIPDADFIKLDTQGSELSIMEGGRTRLMPMVFGAQIEVEFISLYKNQPLFRDVDTFMDRNGFALIDLKRQYWKRKDYFDYQGKGQLVFGDALYFRKIDCLHDNISVSKDPAFGKSKIYKGILVCIVYKIFDYAIGIAGAGRKLGLLTDAEFKDAVNEIRKASKKGFYFSSRAYAKLYNGLQLGLSYVKPRSYLGWADGDRQIGNIKDV